MGEPKKSCREETWSQEVCSSVIHHAVSLKPWFQLESCVFFPRSSVPSSGDSTESRPPSSLQLPPDARTRTQRVRTEKNRTPNVVKVINLQCLQFYIQTGIRECVNRGKWLSSWNEVLSRYINVGSWILMVCLVADRRRRQKGLKQEGPGRRCSDDPGK